MSKNCETVWKNCLAFIEKQISAQSFKTWFSPIVPKKLQNNVLTIQVPSQFFYEWLEEHYLGLLRQVMLQEIGPDGQLEYSIIIDQGNQQQKPVTINLPTQKNHYFPQQADLKTAKNPFYLQHVKEEDKTISLNPNYTFENFVEGGCNQLARSAAQAVAQKPGGNAFNPLMLYGNVGLGKTHIVQAIGNEVKLKCPNKFVIYVPSEQFTGQFIENLRNNSIQEFTNFYLQADVLILDDIQFLSGKEKTQEIFFHIFNHLHHAGKQIIMTSDCPPRELKGLQDRLLSRFKWGLTADLQPPDFETRVAIIKNKIRADGIDIGEDLINYIAEFVDTNIRELEGVIISLIAHASLNKTNLNVALAKQVLRKIVQNLDIEIDMPYITKLVSDYFSIPQEDLQSKTRKKEVVIARQIAMTLAKQYTKNSLATIGKFYNKDHSTVIYALQAIDNLLVIEPNIKGMLEALKAKLKKRISGNAPEN